MKRRLLGLVCLFIVGCSGDDSTQQAPLAQKSERSSIAPKEAKPFPNAFDNDEFGYSIYLPDRWLEYSKSDLIDISETDSTPKIKVSYVGGYCFFETNSDDVDYIMVNRLSAKKFPREDFETLKTMILDSKSTLVNDMSMLAKTEMSLGVPFFEKETGIIWLAIQAENEDGGTTERLTANIYSGDDLLQFMATTTQERAESVWPILERILRTIEIHRK